MTGGKDREKQRHVARKITAGASTLSPLGDTLSTVTKPPRVRAGVRPDRRTGGHSSHAGPLPELGPSRLYDGGGGGPSTLPSQYPKTTNSEHRLSGTRVSWRGKPRGWCSSRKGSHEEFSGRNGRNRSPKVGSRRFGGGEKRVSSVRLRLVGGPPAADVAADQPRHHTHGPTDKVRVPESNPLSGSWPCRLPVGSGTGEI